MLPQDSMAYCKIEENRHCILEMDDRSVCIRREVLRTALVGMSETRGDAFQQDPRLSLLYTTF